jgi:DNA-binding CsgD family transcriptional regulator
VQAPALQTPIVRHHGAVVHTTERPTPRRTRTPTSRTETQVRRADTVPVWVRQLDLPVWVTAPDRTLRYVNRKAERLLGIRAGDWLGRPCHEAVAGRDEDGQAICKPGCAVACRSARNEPQPTVDARVGRSAARSHWTRWTVIPVASEDGGAPWLVHTATDLGRSVECERYLQRLAARSVALREIDPTFRPRKLTPRESEILDLLADDREQGEVARDLGISKTTVRNHVQRLTAAIGAHSIQEAIAMRLLGRV